LSIEEFAIGRQSSARGLEERETVVSALTYDI